MQNLEAEQSVLGALLLDPNGLLEISDWISSEHFSDVRHAVIYNAIGNLIKKGINVDLVTLSEELKANKTLSKIGGRTYLTDLTMVVPSSNHLMEYAKIVKDCYTRRKLAEVSTTINEMASEEGLEVPALIERSQKLIRDAADVSEDPTVSTKDYVREYTSYEEAFGNAADGKVLGIRTGIDPLDEQTYGLIQGQIWVCGAYYGHGKTFFAINVINSLLEQGKRVLFFSLEMSASEVIQRLIGLRARLNTYETLTKQDEEKEKVKQDAKEFIFKALHDKLLVIDDEVRNADSIINRLKSEEVRGHVDLCVVDYIQLMSTTVNQYEELRDAMKNIQMVTKKIKTTMLLLSQINNEAQIAGKGSRVDGFKGAGDIGQVANVAIRIEREKDEETGEFNDIFLLRVTKIRHGKPGNLKLRFEFPGGIITNKREKVTADKIISKDKRFEAFFDGLSISNPDDEENTGL